MKRAVLLLLLALLTAPARAQYATGRALVVFSRNKIPVFVSINGHPVNRRPQARIRIAGLTDDFYRLGVHLPGGRRIEKTVYVPPASEIVYRIEPAGFLQVVDVYPAGNPAVCTPELSYDWNNAGTADATACRRPVSPTSFAHLLQQIRHKAFDDERLQMARWLVRHRCFTSRQILHILQLFSFDDQRLALARYAYRYVYDPENYTVVLDAFSFADNRRKLMRYLETELP